MSGMSQNAVGFVAGASRRESGERGFALRFWTEPEPAAGDRDRQNANIVMLQRPSPGQQLRPLGLVKLLGTVQRAGRTFQDDAPAFGNIVAVGFEKNLIVDCGADQLRTLRGTKKHCPVLDDEIDRKDLGVTLDARDETT